MTYAYYAVMGGFTVDISHLHDTLSRATITMKGILFLAQHGHFLMITKESIQDKSKADILAKGLVCVQVLWVVGQAIERKAAGYPTTLLEVHTIVHIVCALILYALWFQKPQDVHDPTLISSGDFQGALAFMVLSSRFKSHLQVYMCSGETVCERNGNVIFEKEKEKEKGSVPDLEYSWYWFGNVGRSAMPVHSVTERGPAAHAWSRRVELAADHQQSGQIVTYYKNTRQDLGGITRDYTACNILDTYTLTGDPPPETVLTIYSGQALASGFGPGISTTEGLSDNGIERHPSATDRGVKVMLSQKQLAKLDMAGAFLKSNLGSGIGVNRPISLMDLQDSIRGYHARMLCFREANLKHMMFDYVLESGRDSAAPLLATAMILIPSAYGGVHLGAMNMMFPTPIERSLWITACCILICFASGLGGFFSYLCFAMWLGGYMRYDSFLITRLARLVRWPEEPVGELRDKANDILALVFFRFLANFVREMRRPKARIDTYRHMGNYISAMLFFGTDTLIAVLYIAARLYIVIEAFISLRHVPMGVYQTPDSNFMDYIPHL